MALNFISDLRLGGICELKDIFIASNTNGNVTHIMHHSNSNKATHMGPVCVHIHPHTALLHHWLLMSGLELYCSLCIKSLCVI